MSREELLMVVKIAVVPLVLAFAIALGIGALVRNRKDDSRIGQWPGIVAIGIGMLTGQALYFGVHFPDSIRLVEGWQWLMLFAIASIVLLPVSSSRKSREWIDENVRVFLFAGFVVMSVRALAAMERSTALAWIFGAPIVCSVWALALARCGHSSAGRLWPGIVAVVCTVSAITLFLLGSATHFFATATLAAAVGGVFLSQILLRRTPKLVSDAGGNFPLLLLAGFFIVHTLFLDDVPVHTLVILMAAPWGVLVSHIPGVRSKGPIVVGVIQFAVVLAVLAAAFVPVVLHYEPDPYAGY
ncbi:MAG: hypothetical protein H6819_11430 [Phycisphaerales bacterium]|nr:hypothetical protein [Phycisphaerales bacterium]MCB9855003.1 hypothetical protein [Phycisphaerales bacterium]MCB9863480.1 hypothetical protein [Phycisphaerales bacterium]